LKTLATIGIDGRKGGKRFSIFLCLKSILRNLLAEHLDPPHVFAAVFVGVFIGVVPIYGLQSLTAIGIAVLFRLNKPLTYAGTFINNPFFQPLLILGSIELGHYARQGAFLQMASFHMRDISLGNQFMDWAIGSLLLGSILATVCASIAAFFVYSRSAAHGGQKTDLSAATDFVRKLFNSSPWFARGFVRWKLRLDKIFKLLLSEIDSGPVADLGCGYGIALSIAAFKNQELRLFGCDLDANRIRIGGQALHPFNAQLLVNDVRAFEFGNPGLILIIDVLQYLNRQEQCSLLQRCCEALSPGGKLIFRVPDMKSGVLSMFTSALDKLIFRIGGSQNKPVVLRSAEYEKMLCDNHMNTRRQRLTSRLPLAHNVFIAMKITEPGQSVGSNPVSMGEVVS
jgi:uncharacterized protein (DUF2062 family)/trans-aconitate methyltransferase